MNKRILAILLIARLALTSFALEPTSSPNPSGNEYGIDPGMFYPGTLVTELLLAAEDEATAAARDAFDLGYKEGRIDASALWRPAAESAERRAKAAEKRPSWRAVAGWAAAAFLAGCASAFAVCAVAR